MYSEMRSVEVEVEFRHFPEVQIDVLLARDHRTLGDASAH